MPRSSTRPALTMIPDRRRIARAGCCANVRFVRKSRHVPLTELRSHAELANMRLLARGNRLSITPVSPEEWTFITNELMDLR